MSSAPQIVEGSTVFLRSYPTDYKWMDELLGRTGVVQARREREGKQAAYLVSYTGVEAFWITEKCLELVEENEERRSA